MYMYNYIYSIYLLEHDVCQILEPWWSLVEDTPLGRIWDLARKSWRYDHHYYAWNHWAWSRAQKSLQRHRCTRNFRFAHQVGVIYSFQENCLLGVVSLFFCLISQENPRTCNSTLLSKKVDLHHQQSRINETLLQLRLIGANIDFCPTPFGNDYPKWWIFLERGQVPPPILLENPRFSLLSDLSKHLSETSDQVGPAVAAFQQLRDLSLFRSSKTRNLQVWVVLEDAFFWSNHWSNPPKDTQTGGWGNLPLFRWRELCRRWAFPSWSGPHLVSAVSATPVTLHRCFLSEAFKHRLACLKWWKGWLMVFAINK